MSPVQHKYRCLRGRVCAEACAPSPVSRAALAMPLWPGAASACRETEGARCEHSVSEGVHRNATGGEPLAVVPHADAVSLLQQAWTSTWCWTVRATGCPAGGVHRPALASSTVSPRTTPSNGKSARTLVHAGWSGSV